MKTSKSFGKPSSGVLQFIRKKSLVFAITLVLVLVVLNAGYFVYSNYVFRKTTHVQNEAQEIKTLMHKVWDGVVRNVDLGLRGYALTKDDALLLPYRSGLSAYQSHKAEILEKLESQGYHDIQGFHVVIKGYDDYIKFTDYMISLVKSDNMELFQDELKKDKGLTLYRIYDKFAKELNEHQTRLHEAATAEYEHTNNVMSILQIMLGILGLPTLVFIILKLIHDEKKRLELFKELEENNREYLFNPGTALEVKEGKEVISNSILNFKKAADFINQVSSGNLQVTWEGINEENINLNQKNLAGELLQMQEKMRQLKAEDTKRMWSTEGQAKFSEILRTYQHDLKTLCDNAVAFIVKYLSAQQGGLFILREQDDEKYLELVSCYAFNKKKFIEKRVNVGQGLVGQVYLEKQSLVLTEIPQGYLAITSGLGEANPNILLVIPMKNNERVEAVIEIASFESYEKYQVEWIEKIGEIMASSLFNLKNSENTQMMLDQFRQQTEQLRAQEEELRQNMEELEATQEEIRRQKEEMERRTINS